MSFLKLPNNLPGTSFARYIQQEQKKFLGNDENYAGIFQDIEAEAINTALIKSIINEVGGRPRDYRYRGKLDGRTSRPYPGPCKEGNFWVVEYEGQVGSSLVSPGDIILRLRRFDSDWTLIPTEKVNIEVNDVLSQPLQVTEKRLTPLRPDGPKPKTKAAPGPQKRKVILEDE